MPPSPIITRWGTWLKAAVYYSDNFNVIEAALRELNEDDAEAIRVAKNLLKSANLKAELSYIKSNFYVIVQAITKLETPGLELKESIGVFENVRKTLASLNKTDYRIKFENVIARNKGYSAIFDIHRTLNECVGSESAFIKQYSPSEVALFKYCPVTSSDVERSFSKYSAILSEKRRNFLFENLKQHLIVYANINVENVNE